MKKVDYRTNNKEEYNIILRLMHGDEVVTPPNMRISQVMRIVREINKYSNNITSEMTPRGIVLRKINTITINPMWRKPK
jgi:hypothetical protein